MEHRTEAESARVAQNTMTKKTLAIWELCCQRDHNTSFLRCYLSILIVIIPILRVTLNSHFTCEAIYLDK